MAPPRGPGAKYGRSSIVEPRGGRARWRVLAAFAALLLLRAAFARGGARHPEPGTEARDADPIGSEDASSSSSIASEYEHLARVEAKQASLAARVRELTALVRDVDDALERTLARGERARSANSIRARRRHHRDDEATATATATATAAAAATTTTTAATTSPPRRAASSGGGDGDGDASSENGDGAWWMDMDGDDALPDGASLRDRPTAYAAVVVIACDRVKYLTRTVESIARAVASSPDPKKTREEFPLFISQDGDDARTTTYARTLEGKFYHVRHRQERLPKLRDGDSARHRAYYRISAHYKHALGRLFDDLGYERVVILEDDMDLAPDFFAYFRRLGDVLERDPSVYAISSWNDNGQKSLVKDERRLYRSDFFPGLGWMMHARLWKELRPKWPDAYWDDWMRQSAVRLGRETIRPEVCRTFNFGEKGASEGQWYKTHLANVKLASEKVDWGNEDLSYLDADAYERAVAEAVDAATPARDPSQITRAEITNPKGVFKVLYKDEAEFRRLAAKFHVFPEWKDGVPRGGYRGVVHLKMNDGRHEVMLVPRDAAKVTKTFAEYLASVDGGKAEVLGL